MYVLSGARLLTSKHESSPETEVLRLGSNFDQISIMNGSKSSQIEESEIYEFGPYRLDARERTLLLDGRSVALTSKSLDTLIVLVRNHPKIVSKEELLETVWPGTFVEEGILAQNIMTLRKALPDPEWIETVPKRGYRLVDQSSRVRHPGNRAYPAHCCFALSTMVGRGLRSSDGCVGDYRRHSMGTSEATRSQPCDSAVSFD